MTTTEILNKLYVASLKAENSECRYPQWGYQNLEWYISSDRASAEFVSAIAKLTERKTITLIRKAAVGNCQMGIEYARKFLRKEVK